MGVDYPASELLALLQHQRLDRERKYSSTGKTMKQACHNQITGYIVETKIVKHNGD